MKKEVADAWIADLRSGKHKQTTGSLYDGKGYCCLGRLCEVLGHKAEKFEDGINYYYDGECVILPESVRKEAGMNSRNGYLKFIKVSDDWFYCHLAAANDAGRTFDEIADVIKKYWKNL